MVEKILMTLILVLFFAFISHAQIQIKPLPTSGYEHRIRDFVDQLKVVDTHEHLMDPEILKEHGCGSLDFSLLMFFYTSCDLSSAGMPGQISVKLWSNSMSVMEKWQAVEPYWEGTFNTAYSRGVLLAADNLFGIKNIDSSTVVVLSEKIRNVYQNPKEWFNKVLKEKCNIEYVVEDRWDWDDRSFYDPGLFRFVYRFDNFIGIKSKGDIESLIKLKTNGVANLDELISALEKAFHLAMDKGMVGVKSALAYSRILSYDNVTKKKAEEVFNNIKNSTGNLSFDEVKPLQDYMMHRVLYLARQYRMPVQFHTGLQGDNNNLIENSKPTHLVNLFQEYPDVKFILFHGSYPYGGELATLAKQFPNVYIDMCWLYIISPSYSERYLHEWLETVPANKIMAFGGDFCNVEGVYSHLLRAKQVVSNVLIAKVRDGYFSEGEALKVAQMILHDNAVRILKLK